VTGVQTGALPISLVWEKMKKRFKEKVFISNLRGDPSILSCLLKELRELYLQNKSNLHHPGMLF
jgi:hypothetical protein